MIHVLALSLYGGAFAFWLRSLLRGARGREATVAFVLAASGVLAHGAGLVRFVVRYGELPLAGLAPSLSTLALVIGLGLMATLALGEASRVGIVLVPIMILLEGAAAVLGVHPRPGPPLDFQGAWFSFHVTLAFAGYGSFALAFASGLLYLIQFHELKVKRLGRLFRFLPPLATLDRLVRLGLVTGTVTLGLALFLGWAWTVRFRQSFEVTDPKVLWGVFTWLVLVGALVLRRGSGRREHRAALASVAGFAAVAFTYVLLRLAVGEGGFFL